MEKMLALAAVFVVTTLGLDVRAQALYDVQFEANGMTYTLYDQSFPLIFEHDTADPARFYRLKVEE